MEITTYNKLVRDKIPTIIEAQGKTCVCETLPYELYIQRLNDKLLDEAHKFRHN